MVSVIAVAAVGFFVPSLLIANVSTRDWLPFTALAIVAGVVIAGTFFIRQPPRGVAMAFALANAIFVAILGVEYRGVYHEIPLLFALLIGAHAVVHGLAVASVAVAVGSVLIPVFIQDAGGFNWTDPIYTVIYLFGVALTSWTATRLAARRLEGLRRQYAITVEMEREAVHILARAAEAKDEITGDHVARVGNLSAALAERVGLGPATVEDLRFAAMLHDVGKLHVPDRVLMKPGPLTLDEWQIVRQHTIWGERILGSSRGFGLARIIARSHHENWDGSGYPDGLMGDGIPMAARIVRLVDAFDALRNARPYKPPWALERCLEEIGTRAESLFDPELAREFLKLLEANPELATPPLVHLPMMSAGARRLVEAEASDEDAAPVTVPISVLVSYRA